MKWKNKLRNPQNGVKHFFTACFLNRWKVCVCGREFYPWYILIINTVVYLLPYIRIFPIPKKLLNLFSSKSGILQTFCKQMESVDWNRTTILLKKLVCKELWRLLVHLRNCTAVVCIHKTFIHCEGLDFGYLCRIWVSEGNVSGVLF